MDENEKQANVDDFIAHHPSAGSLALYFWIGVAVAGIWVGNTSDGKYLIYRPDYDEPIETSGILPYDQKLAGMPWKQAVSGSTYL